MKKALFLTHPNLLYSEITGGVQLCSQELLRVIKNCKNIDTTIFPVQFTRKLFDRALIKLGLENYSMYDVKVEQNYLLEIIANDDFQIVFINMSSAMRYARVIKEKFGNKIKIILLSHGNHSGDYLHLITKPLKSENKFHKFIKMCRLGILISNESNYRINYLDAVVVISQTELQIENWFGAKRTLFFPRFLEKKYLSYSPDLNKIGFVGRLDHPPNIQGINILCNEWQKQEKNSLTLRLVGAPASEGNKLAAQFEFIEYLGELTEEALEKEASSWAFFLNPVWWYSTGASTKLAKAISWGIPIATTTAGMRGYEWGYGKLLVAETPIEMLQKINEARISRETILKYSEQTRMAASSGPDLDELSLQLEDLCFESIS